MPFLDADPEKEGEKCASIVNPSATNALAIPELKLPPNASQEVKPQVKEKWGSDSAMEKTIRDDDLLAPDHYSQDPDFGSIVRTLTM